MKITVSRSDLHRACANAVRGNVRIKPILGCVCLTAAGESLDVVSTDLDTFVSVKMPATVARSGECCLPSSRLAGILATSVDGDVTIGVEGSTATIATTTATYELPTDDPSEFPSPPTGDGTGIPISTADFRVLIDRTAFATGAEHLKYAALRGVRLEVVGRSLFGVATDGKRLAAQEVLSESTIDRQSSCVVPASALRIARKWVPDNATAWIWMSSNSVSITWDGGEVHSLLVEGNYPQWRSIVPASWKTRAVVSVDDFTRALRQSSIVLDESNRGVKLSLLPSGATISLESQSPCGRSMVTCPAEVAGSRLDDVVIDPKYFLDGVTAMRGAGSVVIEATTATKPVLLTTVDEFYRYVVVPMSRGD